MKVALTACGLVAACAIAVLALDQPAAAAPPPERSTCCAFPDQEYGSADGLTVLLPTGWKVRLAMMEHFAIEGDQGEWVSINPVPSHRVDAELRESQRRASNDPAVWTRTIDVPRANGPGRVLLSFRAPSANVSSLARRFDTVVRSARDAQGRPFVTSFWFASLADSMPR